jgi:hypothetical protein
MNDFSLRLRHWHPVRFVHSYIRWRTGKIAMTDPKRSTYLKRSIAWINWLMVDSLNTKGVALVILQRPR